MSFSEKIQQESDLSLGSSRDLRARGTCSFHRHSMVLLQMQEDRADGRGNRESQNDAHFFPQGGIRRG